MKRFRNILLVCDEQGIHEEAVSRAIGLALENDARIALVDVLDSAPGEIARVYGSLPGNRAKDVERELIAFHEARLKKIASSIESVGIETTISVLQGIPFLEIIRKVLRDGHDLVFKGTTADPVGHLPLYASMDLHLLRKCPCPVWVLKKSSERGFARILAAVDPDAGDRHGGSLNTVIMDLATSLAARDQSELHVVNAWQLVGEETMRSGGFMQVDPCELDRLATEQEQLCNERMNTLLQRYHDLGGTRQVHLFKGPPREVVPGLAEECRADLIIMGTVARTGIQGLFIGNTAEAVLSQVRCSILAVKPPGFVTPVR